MSSTFGSAFRVTTWGESHGRSVGCVLDGCPAGVEIARDEIQKQLDRRRPGQSKLTTPRGEPDSVEILSGVFEDKTIGTPIGLLVYNKDTDSSKYEEIRNKPRPGHADYTWKEKFGHYDWRGGGRASARETVGRVAAGAVAQKMLATLGIRIVAYTTRIGPVTCESPDPSDPELSERIESNPVRTADLAVADQMAEAIADARKDKDSVGGVIEVVATGVPIGLGEPVFEKLDAAIAHAMMSIPATKGVEIGGGFPVCSLRGSQSNDVWELDDDGEMRTRTNNAGGILGGISNGMPIVARIGFKPVSSIPRSQETVDIAKMEAANIEVKGRHDPCVLPRAVPIVESMLALVLADHAIIQGIVPRSFAKE
ncbi:MAG: chorismate synthase [Planctomycetota bacterium]|jgi:chorismate synthase|nr:chorismate synthase [Planctomycetota bacterium]